MINYANYFGGTTFYCTWNGEGLPKTGRPVPCEVLFALGRHEVLTNDT